MAKLRRLLNDDELALVRKAFDMAKAEAVDTELTKAVYRYRLTPGVFTGVLGIS